MPVKAVPATSAEGQYLSTRAATEKETDAQVKDRLKAVTGFKGTAEKWQTHYNIAIETARWLPRTILLGHLSCSTMSSTTKEPTIGLPETQ
ncbi:hypothetical protein Slin15195_G123230 [Septoria linicola]|uniref:Uncharacterized protein n=1 Tax=Septoria linicola TaxID=215465 RepID=A0A9Q9B151_9PEZI|nr:hypothetical protein Slin14017_G079430 [Septoria linicola]USW59004.1 hypothetical protein Slin15195_G123230 [Septoria linicola]